MTLVLVRHGESAGNVAGIIQGWHDAPLTEAGREQARAVARRLAGSAPVALYASPLSRALDTAQAIGEACGLEPVLLGDLRERFYSEAQGMTWDEAAAQWPLAAGYDRDWAAAIPGVESLADLRARSVRAVEETAAAHPGELVVVVSHGGTLVQVIAHLLGLPVGTWPRIRMSNTSVTVVEGMPDAPQVRLLNDICHLDDRERAATLAL